MTKTTKALIASAAIAGLFSGTAARAYTVNTSGKAGISAGTKVVNFDDDKGKHDCKGQNSCKGQGGCKGSDNGCKGKNSCKGKGGCSTKS